MSEFIARQMGKSPQMEVASLGAACAELWIYVFASPDETGVMDGYFSGWNNERMTADVTLTLDDDTVNYDIIDLVNAVTGFEEFTHIPPNWVGFVGTVTGVVHIDYGGRIADDGTITHAFETVGGGTAMELGAFKIGRVNL